MALSLKTEIGRIFSELEKFNQGNPLHFSDQIYFLRKKFTERREQLLSGYMNHPDQFAAYSSFHFPLHLPEQFWILENLFQKIEFKNPSKILDLGCGPGTASLATQLWFHYRSKQGPKDWIFVDQSRRALDCAQTLHPEKSHFIRSNLVGLKANAHTKNADWILLSHVLNEMGSGPRVRDKKIRLLNYILQFLSPGGLLFLIDPPLREPTHDLMWLRDQLVESEDLRVIAPCPLPTALCPMLQRKMGWCYAQPPRTWAQALGLGPWDKMLERVGKIKLNNPGFSYLVLAKSPFPKVKNNSFIALSDPMGKQSWICEGKNVARGPVPFRGAYLDYESDDLPKTKRGS